MRKLYFLLLLSLFLSCENDKEQNYTTPLTPKENIIEQPAIGNKSFQFDKETQVYHLKANNSKDLRFLWSRIEGDFILDVKIPKAENAGTYGLMLATNLDDKTPIAALQIVDNELAFMTAAQVNMGNAITGEVVYLRLERSDNQLIAYYARPNEDFFPIASQQLNNEIELYGGLFAHTTNQDLSFANLRLSHPAPESKEEIEKRIVSSVEIFHVSTRQRKILFQKNVRIEAPNWHPTDSFLLVNSEGLLYQIPLSAKEGWQAVDLGFLNHCTQHHGFSLDGKQLFFSHQDSSATSIYQFALQDTLPPKIVIQKSPSLWQSISPDGTEILYTAKRRRRKSFNIYKSSIDTFREARITKTVGADRGASVHPDGEKIYYSATRPQRSKIWSMNKVGLQKRQLTFDEYEDYFPHVSPNGKHLVFLSRWTDGFSTQQTLSTQPLVIRILDLTKENAQPEIVAHLLGDEGSLAMPSWSPDSQHFSFISYSFAPKELVVEAKNRRQAEI
ncbi:MAG: hypothetical protein AAF599_09915 [Bacteroidota bacterium]